MKHSSQIDPNELKEFGGKTLGLLWLKARGYHVPDFHVIASSEVSEWLKESQIFHKSDFVEKKTRLFEVIKNGIKNTNSEIWLNVAVRSSAADEDGRVDSFAGVHESVLEVKNQEQAIIAISTVIESGFSDIANSYRQFKSIEAKCSGPAIIVQKMVKPIYAGVVFGQNLQTGCRFSAWISVTNGLADKLVSGHQQGDEFLYEKGDIKRVSGSVTKIDQIVLRDIAQVCLDISDKCGHPQDIEWAYDGEKIWVLQVRPITTHIIDKNLPITIFDNSNIQESYCGVTTPLTFTYASIAYFRVYKQLMKLMLMSESEIEQAEWSLRNMLGLVNGRVYYNINNWYAGLLYMPSFGKRKKEMEDMMGLEKSVDFVQGLNLSSWEKFLKIPKMSKLLVVMIYRFSFIDRLVDDFDVWFKALYRQANIDQVYKLNEYDIFEKIRNYQDFFLEKWGIPVLNDVKTMMDMGAVKRVLEKYKFEGELKSIIYGSEIESVKPTLEIHKLSKLFASDLKLKSLLLNKRGDELLKILEMFYPLVYNEVKTFVTLYGDRCMGELKLETVTMRQDIEILFSLVRNFIESGIDQKETLFQNHKFSTEDLFSEILAKMSWWNKLGFRRKVEALKKSIAHREKMRLHRTRNFGLMRVLYLALGAKWAQRKLLLKDRDIFYLTHEEILNIGSGKITTTSIQDLVTLRKKDFEKFSAMKLDGQVSIEFPPSFNQTQNKVSPLGSKKFLSGLACSQGVCEGEIVLVRDSNDTSHLAGKILLAERTDPGWTPLFTLVKGVIVERGSMLSHSAIIAREMAIPSVIGIPEVTQILKTGDYVRLDGNNGTIEIIRRELESTNPIELQS